MAATELILHPDDDTTEIAHILTDESFFSGPDSHLINAMLSSTFATHGDCVYDAAYPVFIRACEQPVDE